MYHAVADSLIVSFSFILRSTHFFPFFSASFALSSFLFCSLLFLVRCVAKPVEEIAKGNYIRGNKDTDRIERGLKRVKPEPKLGDNYSSVIDVSVGVSENGEAGEVGEEGKGEW